MKNKTIRKQFRFTEQEWNRIKILARNYSDGNVSKWVRYAIFSAPRKFLNKG